jgi:hypothetical protein
VKMLELVVGMPGVRILGVEATPAVIRIEVESTDDETVCRALRRPGGAALHQDGGEGRSARDGSAVALRRQASSVAVSVRAVSRDEVAGARSDR